MERLILIMLVGLLGCSKTDRRIEIEVTDNTNEFDTLGVMYIKTDSVDYYSAAFIYTDTDSDSLLINDDEFDKLILFYRTNGKLVNEKEYGSDDCSGKYKQFELNGRLLTINKSNCGDYGFSNSQYLIKGDSLLRARKYDVKWNVLQKEFELDIIEQIFIFNAGGG